MISNWLLSGAPGLTQNEEFATDVLESLERAVTHAPSQPAAAREARIWLGTMAPSQHGERKRSSSSAVEARHVLALVGCSPLSELEHAFPSVSRELLGFLRPGTPNDTRSVALAATDELLRRLLRVGEHSGNIGPGTTVKSDRNKSITEVSSGGARQAVVGILPKLVLAVTACLEGTSTKASYTCGSKNILPSDPMVTFGALGVLEVLLFSLRSTMRPHLRRVQIVSTPWLQGSDDRIRDRTAAVLASLSLCGEADEWTRTAAKFTLGAHSLLEKAWPDSDVHMGLDMGLKQIQKMLDRTGGNVFPPLEHPAGGDQPLPQETTAVLVARRFKGLCRVLEMMLTGDSNSKAVAVPVTLILALIERVQRMPSTLLVEGPQALVPITNGALSQGALYAIRPTLELESIRLLGALASSTPAMVLRNSRRFCRALVQGMARLSSPPLLRAAGYSSIAKAILQLGTGSTPYLATPALPALLAEVRAAITMSDPSRLSTANGEGSKGKGAAKLSDGIASVGGKGTRVQPAMSARKSSQKKQRKSREKMERALAAADASTTSASAPSGNAHLNAAGGGAGGQDRMAAIDAACAALSCLTQVVLCCKAHLPLAGRMSIEDIVHQGLALLARAGLSRRGGGTERSDSTPMEDPRMAQKFIELAHACVMTPLGDGTRSGTLSLAVTVFQSFRSHPDGNLAAASQLALAGCGALLYPRAAPLHLPHAVTSQAKAWGSGDDNGLAGLPLGWSNALEEDVGEEPTALEAVDDTGKGTLVADSSKREKQGTASRSAESPTKMSKTSSKLPLFSPKPMTKQAFAAAVVTPSSEGVAGVSSFSTGRDVGSSVASPGLTTNLQPSGKGKSKTDAQIPSTTRDALASRKNGGGSAATDTISDDGNTSEISVSKIARSSLQSRDTALDDALAISDAVSDIRKEASGASSEDSRTCRKRPRTTMDEARASAAQTTSNLGPIESTRGAGGDDADVVEQRREGLHERLPRREQAGIVADDSLGDRGDGYVRERGAQDGDEGSDDDFEFPSIVDADPDEN